MFCEILLTIYVLICMKIIVNLFRNNMREVGLAAPACQVVKKNYNIGNP